MSERRYMRIEIVRLKLVLGKGNDKHSTEIKLWENTSVKWKVIDWKEKVAEGLEWWMTKWGKVKTIKERAKQRIMLKVVINENNNEDGAVVQTEELKLAFLTSHSL